MFQETEEQRGIAVQQQAVSELDYQKECSHACNSVLLGLQKVKQQVAHELWQGVAKCCYCFFASQLHKFHELQM
jgi:hypothetical protein